MATYGHTFTSGDTVTPTKLNNARTVSDIVNADIANDTITNAKIKSDAAIAGTKIAPSFGNQNITFSTANRSITNTDNFALSLGTNNTERVNIEAGSAVVNLINADNSLNPAIRFRRAKGSPSAPTIVASGDNLGGMVCAGYDGTSYIASSVIRGEVDGTPGTNDMPGRLIFGTTADGANAPTERMRITSNGDVLIAKTSVDWSLNGIQYEANNRATVLTNTSEIALSLRRNTSNGAISTFNRDATQVGTISVTTTATAYNTSSDYRLKENPQPMVGALSRLADVKPVTFIWKSNGSQGEGFIAHELQAVVPEAVTGEKDAVNAEGQPQYQGVDAAKIVPLLVAAVQELSAKVAALEAAQ